MARFLCGLANLHFEAMSHGWGSLSVVCPSVRAAPTVTNIKSGAIPSVDKALTHLTPQTLAVVLAH